MLRVIDIMSRDVVLTQRETTIKEAAQLMAAEGVGSIIVTQHELPIGIVTETDFTRDVVAGDINMNATVDKIMSSPLYHSNPDADMLEVANAMTTNHIKKVPVMDGNKIIGVVTQTDIIKHVFRTIRSLQQQHQRGTLTSQQYAEKSSQLFSHFDAAITEVTKNWYMRCKDCGATFMNPEQQGRFGIRRCPRCDSEKLEFDPTPSI